MDKTCARSVRADITWKNLTLNPNPNPNLNTNYTYNSNNQNKNFRKRVTSLESLFI